MNLIKNVRHFGLAVNNLEKSLNFYQNLLGFKIVRSMDESGDYIDNMLSLNDVCVKTVKLSIDDGITLIELLEFKSHKGNSNKREIYEYGASHLALTVHDLDTCYEELKRNGVEFYSKPQHSPDGFAKVVFCKDPDGTPVELVQVLN
jgi:catechol 2,3-dioxygenase-like lactoylglutathione lyase family enzyme